MIYIPLLYFLLINCVVLQREPPVDLGTQFCAGLHLEITREAFDVEYCYGAMDIVGDGGMRLAALWSYQDYVYQTGPTVLYLKIGCNDLNVPNCDHILLAGRISACPPVRYT